MEKLKNFINNQFVDAQEADYLPVINPATNECIAEVPLSSRSDLDNAVAAAKAAFPAWRRTPPAERAKYIFKFRELMEEHFEEIAKLVTIEHGKTLAEGRGDVRRGMDNLDVACGIPSLMQGEALEDVSRGIDCVATRRPMGVFGGITPFNFPAMVPLWFIPYALATGNTYVLKPSEQVPTTQQRMFELWKETGLPDGVLNMVHGGKEIVNGICEHPDIVGVSFVGSTPIAKHVYETSTKHGKRAQALGGAKNYLVVMPDAHFESTVKTLVDSCYGCAGERCLAGATLVLVGEAHAKFKDAIVAEAQRIKVGNGLHEGVTMGPVISQAHKERVLQYIEKGIEEGAELLLDGRKGFENSEGAFIGPTVFDKVTPEMTIGKEEIFGPVLCLIQADDLQGAVDIIESHNLANTTSIFTSSGKHARDFAYSVEPSMMGVNIGVAAPMSYFNFGGAKDSFFGDLKAHGKHGIEFFTDRKVVISRWF